MSMADELRAIIAGLVGGLRYGFKIRLPHAFVMTALFRRDLSSEQKLRTIWNLAREHATNLATFATIYKVRIQEYPSWSNSENSLPF
jgi:peroxisomal membrane protein 4